jgi:type I restriction enzyme M protein
VQLVDNLRLDDADADSKGDLFEYVLKQIRQAGELGQFRTPRHIIRAIVAMADPRIGETVYDPAAGTAGFLVAAYDHIRLANSSDFAIQEVEVDGKTIRRGYGDRLSQTMHDMLATTTFFGNDVDAKMVSLATMNLMLRGLPDVHILRRNVLTTTLDRAQRAEAGLPLDGFAVVLANPPFSGKIDKDRIVDEVKVGTTTATEILFVKYMLNSLKPGGRCGVIVPEGVLFGPTGAHKELRRQLIENNAVDAVLSLPGGVFQPYSGVKTSVLLFRKGGATERVMFLHADADGYKLDANHASRLTTTTCRGWSKPSRAVRPAGGGGRRAIRKRHGPRSGGSRARTSCGPTISISPPAATARSSASRSSTVIRSRSSTS